MGTFGREPDAARPRDLALVLVATFGLATCITLMWLGMRAVMDIGGACAEGGPFVPVQPCPDGAPAALTLGMFGLFGFGALGVYAGAQVGGEWAALPLLGWPALFLSLGWNFLEYGFTAVPGELVWGWVVPGVIFVLMGGVPLAIGLRALGGSTPIAARFGMPFAARPAVPGPSLGWDVSHRAGSDAPVAEGTAHRRDVDDGPAGGDVVARLERLADLRRRGDLTNEEYERFKAALLRDAEGRA